MKLEDFSEEAIEYVKSVSTSIDNRLEQVALVSSNNDEDMRKLWLNKEISKLKAELKPIRSGIQKTKFAILLSKRWFDEFDSRADNIIEQDGWQYTFIVDEEAIAI
jgi:hypothetical protein